MFMFEKDDLITWKTHLFLIMYMSYEHQWLFGSENTNNIKICSFKKIKTSKFVYTLLQIRSQKKNIELKKKKTLVSAQLNGCRWHICFLFYNSIVIKNLFTKQEKIIFKASQMKFNNFHFHFNSTVFLKKYFTDEFPHMLKLLILIHRYTY